MKQIVHLVLLLPALLQAQGKNEELLNWSADRKLRWSDYKASPDPENDAAASTTTYLSIEYNMKNGEFGYKIESRFSKDLSWGRHKSDYILAHEQGHFDIAEIFARKLHKNMQEYVFNKRTYQTDLKKIYQDILDEKEKMQDDYDRETNHSINKEQQATWLKKIEKMLAEYSRFADYRQ
jgi:hypothetical protein